MINFIQHNLIADLTNYSYYVKLNGDIVYVENGYEYVKGGYEPSTVEKMLAAGLLIKTINPDWFAVSLKGEEAFREYRIKAYKDYTTFVELANSNYKQHQEKVKSQGRYQYLKKTYRGLLDVCKRDADPIGVADWFEEHKELIVEAIEHLMDEEGIQ